MVDDGGSALRDTPLRDTALPDTSLPDTALPDTVLPEAALPDATPDPLTPELAPFVAQARARLEAATDGLDHEATVQHLEAMVANATVQASRLGFAFPVPEPADTLALGDGSVVVVQRLGEPG
jgi:hypothetical protein